METVCLEDNCAGCMLCIDVCACNAITVKEEIKSYNACINENKCIKCNSCRNICPQNSSPKLSIPIKWYQGWSTDQEMRKNSSSGGIASAISKNFIENSGEVCTCSFKKGEFIFSFFDNAFDLQIIAGSKYVKSNPKNIYRPLLEKLDSGKKVLMIALPCQIAAAKAYTNDHKNLYTSDLICHGTPSPDMLKHYLKGKGIEFSKLSDIKFRQKSCFGLRSCYRVLDKYGTDSYTYTFLTSMNYTENCYSCKYARLERISDITLGDSWGSALSSDEKAKGISLILCQTQKGKELLEISSIELKEVDLQKAVESNQQLKHPSQKPKEREKLLKEIKKGKDYERAVFKIDPIRKLKKIFKMTNLRKSVGKGGGGGTA